MTWCFTVAKLTFWRLEGCKLSWFLVSSESDVRKRQPQAEGLVCPSVAWCFTVVKPMFWTLEGFNLELFLVSSESDVRKRQLQAEGLVRPSVAWCFEGNVLEA